tara:strand:+ start:984 stop:1439 length:456 start_codon:yes stop_codon:yes gene_type:complete
MVRKIRLDQIDDVMAEAVQKLVRVTTLEWWARVKEATPVFSLVNYPDLDSIPDFFTLPNGQVVPFKKALLERGTGGELRDDWQTDVSKPYIGTILNNKEYAEPVAYGQNLPPSWGGQYRTRQATVKGYPEIIAKELENWAKREYEKIKRGI